MSEQTKEGERMNRILSIWMSEQTEEGERTNCILNIWMSEQTEDELHIENLDVRTNRGR